MFVAPGAPSTGLLDTTLDSPRLMTWHEAAIKVSIIILDQTNTADTKQNMIFYSGVSLISNVLV